MNKCLTEAKFTSNFIIPYKTVLYLKELSNPTYNIKDKKKKKKFRLRFLETASAE